MKNQDQKNLLANGQGLTGSTARGESKTNPALTGQLESFLKDRGVNPEEFAGKLSRGEFNNPADVLSAIGNSGEISSEDLVEAEQLADQQTSTIVGSNVGEPPEEETLQLKEAENSSPLQAQGQILNGNFGTSELAQSSKEQAAGDVRRPASISGETEPKSELAGSSALAGATNGLHALMDALRRGDLAGAEEVLRKLELLKDSGVQQVRGNDTIFSLARRLYKGFGKWRRGPKFARK